MKRYFTLIGIAFHVSFYVHSQQVDCTNIGFETGGTLGWVLTNGSLNSSTQKVNFINEITGTVNNRHYITQLSDGADPKVTAEKIPMVAPGSTHSIRIGNTVQGGTFDRIKTSFVVSPERPIFQYQFAVVLQNDSRHEDYQKAGFNILISDSNGQPLTCNAFSAQLQKGGIIEGFKKQGDIEYRNWSTGAIDLRNYIGRTINVEVTAHGCTEMRHYGYAYFDAQCLKAEIKPTSLCPDAEGYMTVKAPEGFGNYTWQDGQTQSTVRIKANLGDVYSVKISPLDKLNESCQFQLDYQVKFYQADTTINLTLCEGESYRVDNTVYNTTGNYVNTIRRANVCDSTIRLNLKIIPIARHSQSFTICEGQTIRVGDSTYIKTGTYLNSIRRASGCDSIITTTLLVEKMQPIVPQPQTVVQGDSILLETSIEPSGHFTTQWSPATGLSCPTCTTTWAHPSSSTTYTILFKNESQICQQTQKVVVSVLPCNVYIPDVFSPNNDQKNDVFFVYGNTCVKIIKEMVIYNRWGETVFKAENFPFSDASYGWNGQYLGKIREGVYAYKILVEFRNGETNMYRGAVALIP